MVRDKQSMKKEKELTQPGFPDRRAELYVSENNDSIGYIESYDAKIDAEKPIFTAEFEIKGKIDYDSQEFQDSELYKAVCAVLETDYKCEVKKAFRWSYAGNFIIGAEGKLNKICMDFIFNERFRYEVAKGYGSKKNSVSMGRPDEIEDISSYIYITEGEKKRYKLYVKSPRKRVLDTERGVKFVKEFDVSIEELFKLRAPGVNDMDIIGEFKIAESCEIHQFMANYEEKKRTGNFDGIQAFELHCFRGFIIGMKFIEYYEEGEVLKLKYWADEEWLKEITEIYIQFYLYKTKRLYVIRKNEENRLSIAHEGLYYYGEDSENRKNFRVSREAPVF